MRYNILIQAKGKIAQSESNMSAEINNITQLDEADISRINQFLADNNQQVFTQAQINFIANRDELDVLGLATHCNLIRGYFGSFSHIHNSPLYSDVNGYDYDTLADEELEGVNKEDYSEADYSDLVKEIKAKYKASVAESGIILSSGTGESDVLFLNLRAEPIFIKHVVFNQWQCIL